jgi:hypothetical protein
MAQLEFTIGAPDYPVLNAFFACREPISIIRGPLGSGKTYCLVMRLLRQMCEQKPNAKGVRPSRWLAIRNSYPELMSTTAKDFGSVFEGLGHMRISGYEPPTFTAKFKIQDGTTIHSEIIFQALDREDSVHKLRGYQLTGIWLSETKELHRSIVDMADLRHGRYPTVVDGGVACTWHGMLGDTNAPDEDHWLFKLAEIERPPGWTFFHQPGGVLRQGDRWVPNPKAENLANLPHDYYLRGSAGKSDDWIKVNLANEYGFTIDGTPVHPEYVDSVHCAKEPIEPDPRYPLILGLDFGRTPAAAICQKWAMDRWVCVDEVLTEDMSAALFAPALKLYLDQHYPKFEILGWGDPAGDHAGQTTETTPLQILRAHGIPCRAAPTNKALLRRAALANPLTRLCMDGKHAFQLSPKCVKLRKALMGGWSYRRLKTTDGRISDEPDKGPLSHIGEALEYALAGGGEGRAARLPARSVPDWPGATREPGLAMTEYE